jgi:two-component system nitrogen regulation response regulator NtrX
MPKETILIVDDEASVLRSLQTLLSDEGYDVVTAASGREALDRLGDAQPALALLDILMPEMDGMETLRRFRDARPEMTVIMVTGHGGIDEAVQSVKLGAYDFITKPPDTARVLLSVRHGLDEHRLRQENEALRRSIERRYELIGESAAMVELKRQIALAGPTNAWVLVHGESGSGKELAARAIHRASKRADGPFIEVNCAAIPQELIESELFGHEKGSFTGAVGMKQGKFELADGGTIFLDEIADMSLATQAKVLRVLEGQEFQRVGGTRTMKVDVRVIAASNKDLQEEIGNGTFREDLFYRLNVVPLEVPPLRARAEDIPVLVRHFLREFAAEYGQRPKTIDDAALELFVRYRWKGNVRELRNFIERMMIMVPGPAITAADVPQPVSQPQPAPQRGAGRPTAGEMPATLKEARAAFEREFIRQKLKENNGNISKTADEIDVERSNLHRKIKALGIDSND